MADHESWLHGRRIIDGDQVRFALEYRRCPLGHAVAYDMEVSSDLKTWQPFEAAATEQFEADGMVRTTLVDTATDRNVGTRFIRVKVSHTHPNP